MLEIWAPIVYANKNDLERLKSLLASGTTPSVRTPLDLGHRYRSPWSFYCLLNCTDLFILLLIEVTILFGVVALLGV